MTICDLCESRQDVIACRIELPHVRDARGHLDLCMKCQQKVFSALELFSKEKDRNQTPLTVTVDATHIQPKRKAR